MLQMGEIDCDSSRESDSSTESASLKGPKLATDSQMPDFLLNPAACSRSDDPVKDEEDASRAELISDDEENSAHPRLASEEKKNNVDVPLAAGPEMGDALFSPKVENETEDITSEDELISDQEEEIALSTRQKKKKKTKKRNVQNPNPLHDRASGEDTESINEELWMSKKQRKKLLQRKATMTKQLRDNEEAHKVEKQESDSEMTEEANIAGEKSKADKAKKRSKREEREEGKGKEKDAALDDDLSHRCVSCSSEFSSKNKLFEHLKKTGHSVHIPELTKRKKNQERKERMTAKGKEGSDKKKR